MVRSFTLKPGKTFSFLYLDNWTVSHVCVFTCTYDINKIAKVLVFSVSNTLYIIDGRIAEQCIQETFRITGYTVLIQLNALEVLHFTKVRCYLEYTVK